MPDFRTVLVRLSALRGDADLEEHLQKKHPDLAALPADTRPGTPVAEEAERAWLSQQGRHYGLDRHWKRKCLHKLGKELAAAEARALQLAAGGNEPGAEKGYRGAFSQAGAAEGPIVCTGLHAQLRGTRFEGTWLAREGPGVYLLGDEPLRVAVQADAITGELLVHGYFEGRFLHEAHAPLVKFMEERGFKPAPGRVKEHEEDEEDGIFGSSADVAARKGAAERSRSPAKEAGLPHGWSRRESRSKPGTYYYVNEAKGLSQFERPAS